MQATTKKIIAQANEMCVVWFHDIQDAIQVLYEQTGICDKFFEEIERKLNQSVPKQSWRDTDAMKHLQVIFADFHIQEIERLEQSSYKTYSLQLLLEYLHERQSAVQAYIKAVMITADLNQIKVVHKDFLKSDVHYLCYLAILDSLEDALKYYTCDCSWKLLYKQCGAGYMDLVEREKLDCKKFYANAHHFYVPLLDSKALRDNRYDNAFMSRRRKMVGFAILNIKRACAPITARKIRSNVKDYLDNLSQDAPEVDLSEGSIGAAIMEAIKDEIAKMPKVNMEFAPRTPSGSATYNHCISDGGTRMEVRQIYEKMMKPEGGIPLVCIDSHVETFKKVYRPLTQCTVDTTETGNVYYAEQGTWKLQGEQQEMYVTSEGAFYDDYFELISHDWIMITQLDDYETFIGEACVGDVWPSHVANAGEPVDEISCGWEFLECGYSDLYEYDPNGNNPYSFWREPIEKVDLLKRAILLYSDKKIHAHIHAILEPFKSRLISAGSGMSATMLKAAQKAIFNSYSTLGYFRSTAGPVDVNRLRQLSLDMYDAMAVKAEEVFVTSVDYRSATDFINKFWTLKVWELLCKHHGMEHLYEAGCNSLTGNILEYQTPDVYIKVQVGNKTKKIKVCDGELLQGEQKNGQLMGCIISFPILSILNQAGIRAAYKFSNNSAHFMPYVDHTVINGDDALFVSNREIYENWLHAIDCIGFKRSPGKNYISSEFLTVNSTLYYMTSPIVYSAGHKVRKTRIWNQYGLEYEEPIEVRTGSLKKLPFINVGLCLGICRVQNDSRACADKNRDGTDFSLVDRINWAIDGLSDETLMNGNGREELPIGKLKEKMMTIFLMENSAKLEKGRPWFLPKHCGGLGIKIPKESIHYEPRDHQVLYALCHCSSYEAAEWYKRLSVKVNKARYQQQADERAMRYPDTEYTTQISTSVSAYDWLTPTNGDPEDAVDCGLVPDDEELYHDDSWKTVNALRKWARAFCHEKMYNNWTDIPVQLCVKPRDTVAHALYRSLSNNAF
jgi:hypothetical protein